MTARDLLNEVTVRGIRLEVMEGGRLKVSAPEGALSPELVEGLRKRKAEVIRLLADGTGSTADGCPCLLCSPWRWPNGFQQVVETWPERWQRTFKEGVQARLAAGVDPETARRAAYLDSWRAMLQAEAGCRAKHEGTRQYGVGWFSCAE